MCELVHCLDETTLSFLPNAAVFSWFHYSNAVISLHNTRRWLFVFLKIINENYSMCISKNWCRDLASRWNCLHLLWSQFSPLVHFFDCSFISGVKWWTHISFMVMNRRNKSALFFYLFFYWDNASLLGTLLYNFPILIILHYVYVLILHFLPSFPPLSFFFPFLFYFFHPFDPLSFLTH